MWHFLVYSIYFFKVADDFLLYLLFNALTIDLELLLSLLDPVLEHYHVSLNSILHLGSKLFNLFLKSVVLLK